MDELRILALEAALRLDQALRGLAVPNAAVEALGFRYAIREVRLAPREIPAHRAAIAAVGPRPRDDEGLDAALAAIGLDLVRAASGQADPALLSRCRDFCLALHESLRDRGSLSLPPGPGGDPGELAGRGAAARPA
jgi:hypothetical protein